MRGVTVKKPCQHCGNEFEVRVAEVKRGWGQYCSKKCAGLAKGAAAQLEAEQAAPVGEQQAYETWLPSFATGPEELAARKGWLAALAYAANQRAQQPQSAEAVAVAWVEVKDRHEGPYDFHGMELMDSGKHYLYATPQPSAGVVMPERKVNHNGDPQKWMNWRDGWNACLDEFARLNGKEVV